jgi:phosphoserine aminotransferase
MMGRVWNFSAGPAALPEEVLSQAWEELLDWHGAGCSVMEMSHRGKEFSSIIAQAEADLRELMGIPAGYKVLFLQGGATQQFAQVPMNLLAGRSADYIVTGAWSKKAFKEAQRIGNVRCAATTEASNFTRLPAAEEIRLDPFAAYLHVCTNETIHGVEIPAERIADTGVPLVADMSSHILSRPLPVGKFGLIYAGAQKNIGPAGVALVIVKDEWLKTRVDDPKLPTMLNYAIHAENTSMYNTPPCFAIYIMGLVMKWLLSIGGLDGIHAINQRKAAKLYAEIDRTGFYKGHSAKECRSLMNVTFRLPSPELEDRFAKEAKAAGLDGLKGHRSVGGLRASIYNAFPEEGIDALVAFMQEFEKKNG